MRPRGTTSHSVGDRVRNVVRVSRSDLGDRATTIMLNRLSRKQRLSVLPPDYPEGVERPRTRGDCADGPRPCPFSSCRYHLLLDVHPETGNIKLNFGHDDVERLPQTCALDVAENYAPTLDVAAYHVNVTRERVRQIEERALAKLGINHPEMAEFR